jgi:hypothetical protein
MTASSPPASDVRRLIGRILIVMGTLWLVLTGLCSVAFLFSLWRGGDPLQGGAPMRFDEALGMTLYFGLPFIVIGGAIGAVIYAIGRRLHPK